MNYSKCGDQTSATAPTTGLPVCQAVLLDLDSLPASLDLAQLPDFLKTTLLIAMKALDNVGSSVPLLSLYVLR